MRSLVPLTLVVVTTIAGCRHNGEATAPLQRDWFVDRAAETGLDCVHVNGMSGKLYMSEILAPGVALFDYDRDGDLDVYLVQGSPLGTRDSTFGVRHSDAGTRHSDAGTRHSALATPGSGLGTRDSGLE